MNRAQRRAAARKQDKPAKRAAPPLAGARPVPGRESEAALESGTLVRLSYDPAQTPGGIFRAHQDWAARHAAPLYPSAPGLGNDPDPERRLRVGYVSADLRRHPVAFFVEPILRAHDRAALVPVCYDASAKDDDMKQHLRQLVPAWRSVADLSDAALADAIRADGIDILVDLSGHTPGNRLLAFARKPAPVQVTAIGYVATTGLATMDYRLTDPWCDPAESDDAFYSEALWRLPFGFNCYTAPQGLPEPGPAPHASRGFVTFGSFNNLDKISDDVLDVWAEILRRTEGSRLLLKTKTLSQTAVQRRVFDRLAQHAIAQERVDLVEWSPTLRSHFEAYRGMDIALDPFPYNGTTTTCEALMMGVPVIALSGDRHAARVSASILARLDLAVLTASDKADYVARAAALANRPETIAGLRASLRARLIRSPLADAAGYARGLEAAYREMWRRWCAAQRKEEVA